MAILTEEELVNAQLRVRALPPGTYELREIYGSNWGSVGSPSSFGAKFKAAVKAELLVGIELHSLKTNNHHVYLITAQRQQSGAVSQQPNCCRPTHVAES